MKECFEAFKEQVITLCNDTQAKDKWLTNKDVCALLQISKRSLQSYRDNGTLPYSQIGHKCYYRVADVEKLVTESTIKNTDYGNKGQEIT